MSRLSDHVNATCRSIPGTCIGHEWAHKRTTSTVFSRPQSRPQSSLNEDISKIIGSKLTELLAVVGTKNENPHNPFFHLEADPISIYLPDRNSSRLLPGVFLVSGEPSSTGLIAFFLFVHHVPCVDNRCCLPGWTLALLAVRHLSLAVWIGRIQWQGKVCVTVPTWGWANQLCFSKQRRSLCGWCSGQWGSSGFQHWDNLSTALQASSSPCADHSQRKLVLCTCIQPDTTFCLNLDACYGLLW